MKEIGATLVIRRNQVDVLLSVQSEILKSLERMAGMSRVVIEMRAAQCGSSILRVDSGKDEAGANKHACWDYDLRLGSSVLS